jgi:Tat protein translocase TatC
VTEDRPVSDTERRRTGDEGPELDRPMSLGDHFEELRSRLVRSLVVLAGAFALGWVFRARLLALLLEPHVRAATARGFETTIKYQSYIEPLYAQLLAVGITSLLVVSPYVLWELWRFVSVGLYLREQAVVRRVAGFSLFLFAGGAAFGFFVLLPLALRFLLVLAGPGTEPVIMMGAYFRLVFLTTVFLGVAFQTPTVIYALIRLDVIGEEAIRKNRGYAIVLTFMVAALLTPPDPVTQVLVALPMILLYDLGVLLARPTRRNLLGVLKFVGLIFLVAGAIGAYVSYWPVAHVTGPEGGTKRPLARGARLQAPAGGATLRLGTRGTVRLAAGARLQVLQRDQVRLEGGRVLAKAAGGGGLELVFAEGAVSLQRGTAEVALEPGYRVTVTSLAGEAVVASGERMVRVTAGRAFSLTFGGQPVDLEPVRARWTETGEK